MKILILCSNLEAGGAQRAAIRLGFELRKKGLLTQNSFFHKKQDIYTNDNNLDLILNYEIKSIYDYYILLRNLKLKIRKFQPDAIISFLHYSNIIGLLMAYLMGVKIRIASHRNNSKKDMSRIVRFIDYFWAKFNIYTHITAVSDSTKKSFSYYSLEDYNRIQVIHNGVDSNQCQYSQREAREYFNFDKNDFILGNIGRLSIQKNQSFLIDVLSNVVDCKLVIVGNGELLGSLNKQIKKLNLEDRILIIKELSELEIGIFFKAIDLYCMPSLYEGLSNALIEALSYGTPVISSNVDSQRDVLIRNTDNLISGVLLPLNKNNWVETIIEIKKDTNLIEKMRKNSRERGMDFSIEKMVSSYLNLLNIEKNA